MVPHRTLRAIYYEYGRQTERQAGVLLELRVVLCAALRQGVRVKSAKRARAIAHGHESWPRRRCSATVQ